MLAVIADPVFDRSDSRFTTPATETGDKTQTQTITGDDARSIEHLAENSGDKSGVTTLQIGDPASAVHPTGSNTTARAHAEEFKLWRD